MRHKIPAFPFNFTFQYFINTFGRFLIHKATANPFEIFPPKSFLTQHERDVCLLPGVVLIPIRSKESLKPKKAKKKKQTKNNQPQNPHHKPWVIYWCRDSDFWLLGWCGVIQENHCLLALFFLDLLLVFFMVLAAAPLGVKSRTAAAQDLVRKHMKQLLPLSKQMKKLQELF